MKLVFSNELSLTPFLVNIRHSMKGPCMRCRGLCLLLLLCSFAVQAQTVNICNHTDQVEEAILSVIPGDNCATVTTTQLSGIKSLSLNSKGITALKLGDFDGLTGITDIHLRDNELVSLPSGIFAGLTNLQRTDLSHNPLPSLPADLFAGLTNLQRINLSHNRLSSLPADLFAGLTNLQRINLWANELSSLPSGIFAGLTNLQRIDLEANKLSSLPSGIFAGLTNLQWIDLWANALSSLPADLFAGLTNLQRINLSFNDLRSIPANLFDHIISGASLDFQVHVNPNLICLPASILNHKFVNVSPKLPPCELTVTLGLLPVSISENGGISTVTATLNRVSSAPTTITVSVAPTAPATTSDYTLSTNRTLTIAAGATGSTGVVTITGMDNSVYAPDKTVTVRGSATNPQGVADPPDVMLMITDDDEAPEVTLLLTPALISENAGVSTVMATLNRVSSAPTMITILASPAPPATTSDYTLSTNRTLTIAAGATGSTGVVTITGVDNSADAPDKTVTVRGSATNPQGMTGPKDVTLTILDDDEAALRITLTAKPSSVMESALGTPMTVTAAMNAVRTEVTPVTLSVDSGTAMSGIDFVAVDAFSITIAANSTTGTGMFTLTPIDDVLDELDETIRVTGSTSVNGITITQDEVVILDDDQPVSLSIQDLTVLEDVGVARVQIDVTPAAPTALTVTYATIAQTATAGSDYESTTGTLSIPAGSTTAGIAIPILDDRFMESTETFLVRLSDAMLGQSEATVTIEDNDTYRLRAEGTSVLESAGEVTFAVTLDAPNPVQAVEVAYETLDGSAMAGTDYLRQQGTLVFPVGEVRREVSVPVIDDTMEEMEETFRLRLSNPEHALLSNFEATGTIRDDDALPVVNVTSSVTVREDAGSVRFAVTLSRALPGRDTEVGFTVPGETAIASLDYRVRTASPLRFLSGQTTQFVDIDIIEDEILEGEETFRVVLTDVRHGVLDQSEGRGTIIDNEDAVTVQIGDVVVGESDRAAVFPVTLSGVLGRGVTLAYTSEDETAQAGQDYEAVAGELRFAAGARHQQIRVPILNDLEEEDEETFLVRLNGNAWGVELTDNEARGTIEDDDDPITVSILDGRATEGSGVLLMPVRLSRASLEVVSVRFASSDASARAGSDYEASRGIVIFERGSTQGRIIMEVLEDLEVEPEETFQVTLSGATNATIARGVGTGTILDDEGDVRVSIARVTVSGSAAEFEVGLSAPSSSAVTVSYTTEDGSAKEGEDYEPRMGEITLSPGEVHRKVRVTLLARDPARTAKAFSLVLLSAVNAELHQVRKDAVLKEEIEKSVLEAYVSRMLRTSVSHVVEALSGRAEGIAQCRVSTLSLLRYGTWRPSPGELFSGCGARFRQGGWSIWGQGAFTRLRGTDGALSLRSEITTVMVGADHEWSGGWMAGVLAAHSLGDGLYDIPSQSGRSSSQLTGLYPYVSYQKGAGMQAWLLLGLGHGDAEVDALESSVGSGLVALGLTGILVGARTGQLGYEVDVFMAAADVEESSRLWVRRVRAGVEGRLRWGSGIQPYAEAALRHDSGEAETGLGLELGGGVQWAPPERRVRAKVSGRRLVLHTAEGLQECGLMAALEYGDPRGLGATAQVRPMWGAVYGGDLWREDALLHAGQRRADQRVEVELGYGTQLSKAENVGKSLVGMRMYPTGREYRIGYNLRIQQGLQLTVATTARTVELNGPPRSYAVSAHMNLQW